VDRRDKTVPELLDIVPEPHRTTAGAALAEAFGSRVEALRPMTGGASAALVYAVEAGGRSYLMRMETRRDAMRNPHQYACMRTAAEAGIAPPLRYVEADAGVAIMDFLPQRPLDQYPGGPAALARALGDLAARLQATPVFPFLIDYRDLVQHLLAGMNASGRFAPGLLDPHAQGLADIRDAYPWDPASLVSSHNDPNPSNVLFDGERLWLIDWETGYRNDPFADVAIMANDQAATPELETELLSAWLGRAPDAMARARLMVMRQLTRLYYAGIIFAVALRAGGPRIDSLDAPDVATFRAEVAAKGLTPGSPEALRTLAVMCLAGFQAALGTRAFRDALAIVRVG
jgi:aminoglycoside phosphotransferase (APT) family kinase protein